MSFKKREEIVLFGSGDHTKVLENEIKKIKKFKIFGVIDNKINKKKKTFLKKNSIKYLGTIKNFFDFHYQKKLKGIIGVGNNFIRQKILKEINVYKKNFQWAKIVSVNATISKNVILGEGVSIISGTIINTGTKIGNHCLINTKSLIDHDNKFEDFSSTGPGAITGGNVKVGKRSHLGIGSVIKNGIVIGNDTIIGGKAFVNKACKKNSIYFGVPAKRRKARSKEDKYF